MRGDFYTLQIWLSGVSAYFINRYPTHRPFKRLLDRRAAHPDLTRNRLAVSASMAVPMGKARSSRSNLGWWSR